VKPRSLKNVEHFCKSWGKEDRFTRNLARSFVGLKSLDFTVHPLLHFATRQFRTYAPLCTRPTALCHSSYRLRPKRWMILRGAPRSVRASIRRNLSQRELRDLIDVHAHHQRRSKRGDAAEAPSHELRTALYQRVRREIQRMLPPLQVDLRSKSYPARKYADSFLAAAAAKINASIQAKKGIQHVDVPPIQSTFSPTDTKTSPPRASSGNSASLVNGEMYIADGDYIRDIEVNDLRNRYTLTKGSTQKMVNTPCVILH